MIPPLPIHETADAADARRFRFFLSLSVDESRAIMSRPPPKNFRRMLDERQAEEIERFNARLLSRSPDPVNAEVRNALAALIDMYVANKGTPHEFISCITPPHGSEMSPTERAASQTWRAWDRARVALAATDRQGEAAEAALRG